MSDSVEHVKDIYDSLSKQFWWYKPYFGQREINAQRN